MRCTHVYPFCHFKRRTQVVLRAKFSAQAKWVLVLCITVTPVGNLRRSLLMVRVIRRYWRFPQHRHVIVDGHIKNPEHHYKLFFDVGYLSQGEDGCSHWMRRVPPPRLIESVGTASYIPPSVVVANASISGFRLNDPCTA
jgi:hypothetical protein